jgi:hypothetical protein
VCLDVITELERVIEEKEGNNNESRQEVYTVLPLTRIFPCSKEILILARNLQGNKIYKEMARKNTKMKGNCKDFCNLHQLQILNQ